MSLLDWFGRFIVFSDQAYRGGNSALEPLFHVVTCWNYWLSGLSKEDQTEVKGLIEEVRRDSQEPFLEQLQGELEARYEASSAVTFFLLQLRGIPEFAHWRSLEPSRVGSVPWVNMVAVKRAQSGSSGVVLPVAVFLRKREPGQPPLKSSPDIDLGDAELERVREAVLGLLGRSGLVCLIILGSFSGWTSMRPWVRWIRLLGWLAVTIGLTVVVCAGPWLGRGVVVSVLSWILPLAILLLFFPLLKCLQEVLFGRRLAKNLAKKQVCIFSGGVRNGSTIAPSGASYCLSLAVAILAAATAEDPPLRKSWLWGRFAEQLGLRAARWAFTGTLSGGGRIGPVQEESLPIKYEACLAHPTIAEFVMPAQDPQLLSSKKMGVQRCRHLASLVLRMGEVCTLPAKVTSALASLCTAALLLASPETYRLFHPLPVPRPVLWKCELVPYPSGLIIFAFVAETDSPETFLVRLTSPTERGLWFPFHREIHSPSHAKAEIPIPGLAVANPPKNGPWSIQVILPQSFLRRGLKDTVVLQEDFDGLRKAAEAERNQLLK